MLLRISILAAASTQSTRVSLLDREDDLNRLPLAEQLSVGAPHVTPVLQHTLSFDANSSRKSLSAVYLKIA
jgi:hypothetical protein